MNHRSLVVLLALLAAVACSEPLEFADWTIPVPEGTLVREYAPVPDEERAGYELVFERDLVIGADAGDEVAFYRALAPKVDGEGRIYVLDSGNHRVQIFGADGRLLNTFGAEGQGPGEFTRPGGLVIAGDRILVSDRENARISEFNLSGEHIADHLVNEREVPSLFAGMDDGTFLMAHYPGIRMGVELPEPVMLSVSRRTVDNEEVIPYIELPMALPATATIDRGGGRTSFFIVPMAAPNPAAALGADGRVYASARDQYQVLAMGAEGQTLWALRVAVEPTVPTEEHMAAVMEIMRERDEAITRSTINWPDRYPAISRLLLDGSGRLYVVPFRYEAPGDDAADPGPVPVDVYSPDGERLFAGQMPIERWSAALGDHVYTLETDDAGDQIVVRYRLVEPFE